MFWGCDKFNGNVSGWNTGSVTNMSFMFLSCLVFNQDVSGWDTSSVTNMNGVFYGSPVFNQDLGSWDVTSVTNMSFMFSDCQSFNQDLIDWHPTSCTNMSSMFSGCMSFNSPIDWGDDTLLVTTMSSMFGGCLNYNSPISFNTSNVTNMTSMFTSCRVFNQVLSFDTSSLITAIGLFQYCDVFDQDLGSWDVSSVTDATNMFRSVTLSTPNYDSLLAGWSAQTLQSNVIFSAGNSMYCDEVSRQSIIDNYTWVITDAGKDTNCPELDSFITTWRTTAANQSITLPLVSGFTYSFDVNWGDGSSDTITAWDQAERIHEYATAGDYDVEILGVMETWRTSNTSQLINLKQWGDTGLTSCYQLFDKCPNMIVTATDTPNLSTVATMYCMFRDCTSLTSLNLSGWDTSNITTMTYVFNGCTSLTILNVSGWDTSSVTAMGYMFFNCTGLTILNVSGWDTSNVTDFTQIFTNVYTDLDFICESCTINNILFMPDKMKTCNMNNSTLIGNMDSMFLNTTNLTSIDMTNINTSAVTNMRYMFNTCSSLTTLDLSSFDTPSVTTMYGMFRGCASLTTLNISGWDTSSVTDMGYMFYSCSSLTETDAVSFDMSSVTTAYDMFYGVTLLTSNYDALLVSWDTQILQSNVYFSAGNSKYTSGSTADTARANIISSYGWNITDAGSV